MRPRQQLSLVDRLCQAVPLSLTCLLDWIFFNRLGPAVRSPAGLAFSAPAAISACVKRYADTVPSWPLLILLGFLQMWLCGLCCFMSGNPARWRVKSCIIRYLATMSQNDTACRKMTLARNSAGKGVRSSSCPPGERLPACRIDRLT